jgi:hypothetical protein
MRSKFVGAGSLVALLAAVAPLGAQSTARTSLEISPYAGLMVFGNLVKGPLGTSLGTSSGAVYGAQLGVDLTPSVSVIGHIGRASGDLEVGLPIIGGIPIATTTAMIYDGAVKLSLPMTTRAGLAFAPFMQAGGGAMHLELARGSISTDATNLVLSAGAGADVALSPSVGLRFMAKDYVGKFDFKEASGFDISGERAHNWALSAGIKLTC